MCVFGEHLQVAECCAQSQVGADRAAATPFPVLVCRPGEEAQPPACHGPGDAVRGVGAEEQCGQTVSEGTEVETVQREAHQTAVFQVGGVGRGREADAEGEHGASGRENLVGGTLRQGGLWGPLGAAGEDQTKEGLLNGRPW